MIGIVEIIALLCVAILVVMAMNSRDGYAYMQRMILFFFIFALFLATANLRQELQNEPFMELRLAIACPVLIFLPMEYIDNYLQYKKSSKKLENLTRYVCIMCILYFIVFWVLISTVVIGCSNY